MYTTRSLFTIDFPTFFGKNEMKTLKLLRKTPERDRRAYN